MFIVRTGRDTLWTCHLCRRWRIQKKCREFKDWRCPQNDDEMLRSFLGLCTNYKRSVKDFSCITRSLHKLTESKQKFLWIKQCKDAFNKLKEALISVSVLTKPQLKKPFILDMDASNESIGVILSELMCLQNSCPS
ncbi:Retrovirus-related Pol polyprotein from transposon 412, partial [Stegodyphus mimosarum]